MEQSRFDQSPLFGFLDTYAPDRKAAAAAMDAVVPVLQGLVRRGFIFERLKMEDLGLLRRDLEILLGFSVREIRVISFDKLFERLPDQSEEERRERIGREVEAIEDSHHDMEEVFGTFDAFLEAYVPEDAQIALEEAFDAALKGVDAQFEDPYMKEALEGMGMTLMYVPMLAMSAAVAGDPIVARRAAAFLPWLAYGVPVGVLKDAPGVYTIATTCPVG